MKQVKKLKDKAKNTKVKSKRKPKLKTKISKKDILILLVSLIVIIGIGFLGKYVYINIKYAKYKEKIEWYGIDKLYNNEKANSNQKVNNEEIAKLTIGTVLNVTDKNYGKSQIELLTKKTYSINRGWLEYANYFNIGNIEVIDLNQRASKKDVAIYLVQAIEKFLKQEIQITETVSDKYIDKLTDDEISYINKAISIGLLKNKKSDLLSHSLIKGELNKMLVFVIEKYNTVYYKSQYDRYSDTELRANLVTDKELLPKNYEIYPYIIDTIEKGVYEITTKDMTSQISTTPKEVYEIYGRHYKQTENNIIDYFNMILNIDYKTLNNEDFLDNINQYFVYDITTDLGDNDGKIYEKPIIEYLKYVKDNKIVLQGKATPLLPIIYSNGMLHFLRVKLEVQVINSDTDKNLLLFDKDTKYTKERFEVYIDLPVSATYSSKSFRVFNNVSMMDYLVLNDGKVEVGQ